MAVSKNPEVKRVKAIESIIKKLDVLKKESSELYETNPTMELSTTMALLDSAKSNIKKLKNQNYE